MEIDRKVLGKERRDFWKRKIAYADIYLRPALVAELDGKVVGFIMGYVIGWEFGVPDTIGWIDTLRVDPAYQRRGIGRALFNALVENFKHSGREKIPAVDGAEKPRIEGVNVVYTLANWNDWELLQFYNAMGFSKGNVLAVKKALRHKRVENTMKYIHRLEFQDPQNYDVATATTVEEIKHLAQAGFK